MSDQKNEYHIGKDHSFLSKQSSKSINSVQNNNKKKIV